jgi:hypothetical protein
MRTRTAICLLALLAAALAQSQERRVSPGPGAGRRIALVIGNNAYRGPGMALQNAANDARAIAELLPKVGFDPHDVTLHINANLKQMQRAGREFIEKLRPGDLALVYYSGHGVEVRGENFLIPVDFPLDATELEARDEAYSAQRLLRGLEESPAKTRLMILDACRNNPLRPTRSAGGAGLARMDGQGTLIVFATSAGQTADDNARGRNGLFTSELLKALPTPGLTVDQMMREVARSTYRDSGEKQTPAIYGLLLEDFPLVAAAPVPPPPPAIRADEEAWAMTKNSTNPQDFEEFAKAFPNSELARTAKVRAANLRRAAEPVVLKPPPAPVLKDMTVTLSADQSDVCPGVPVRVSASTNAASGATYQWTVNGSSAKGDTSLTFATKGKPVGTYTIAATVHAVGFNNGSGSTMVNVREYREPAGTVSASPVTIPAGGTSSLTSSFTGQCGDPIKPAAYSASEGSITGGTFNSSGVRFNPNNTAAQQKAVTITATAVDAKGGRGTATTTITVTKAASLPPALPEPVAPKPPPAPVLKNMSVTLSADKSDVCSGVPVRVSLSTNAGSDAAYQWTINGSAAKGDTSLTFATKGKPVGTYLIAATVRASGFNNGTGSTAVYIREYREPAGSVSASPATVPWGGTSLITSDFSGQCGDPIKPATYSVSEGSVTGGTFYSGGVSFDSNNTVAQQKDVTVTASVLDSKGRRGTATTTITVTKAAIIRAASPDPVAPIPTTDRPRSKVNPKDNLTYVWIPPGTFQMGCSPGDAECNPDEKPAREFTIVSGFWMGQTDVTQEAYQRVAGKNPSHFRGPKLPVEQVDWNEAKAYCAAVGGRLPTEAEWEYAARGGTAGARYGELGEIAWYNKNSGSATHPVGQQKPNPYGLYDMLGNVDQWTSDAYDRLTKALRGGSCFNLPQVVRVSRRDKSDPSARFDVVGFRCVE